MPIGFIRITSRPEGGAPPEIRDKWIGLTLPVVQDYEGALADVTTHQKVDRRNGWEVTWDDAMQALGEADPAARAWWEEHIVGFSTLVFRKDCCVPVAD